MTKSSKAVARTCLVVVGESLLIIASRMPEKMIGGFTFTQPTGETIHIPEITLVSQDAVILILLGLGLLLFGCWLWTRLKNRHWAFMFWGLIPVWGLLPIALLRNKSSDFEGVK